MIGENHGEKPIPVILAAGAIATFLGVVLLDSKTQVIQFKPLDRKQAAQLQISSRERRIFNKEVDTLNLLMQEVQRQNPKSIQESKQMWQSYVKRTKISKETLRVIKQMGQQNANRNAA